MATRLASDDKLTRDKLGSKLEGRKLLGPYSSMSAPIYAYERNQVIPLPKMEIGKFIA